MNEMHRNLSNMEKWLVQIQRGPLETVQLLHKCILSLGLREWYGMKRDNLSINPNGHFITIY